MDSRKDVMLALAIVALGLAVISLTLSFPEPVVKDRIGPQAFPLGIGLLFLFGGSVLAVQRMRNLNAAHGFRVTSEGNEDEPGYPASGMRALLIVAHLPAATRCCSSRSASCSRRRPSWRWP